MKRRHLTPNEIKEQCKHIAREVRMADRTPWTAMGIVCGYALYKSEGFKGQKIAKVTNKVAEYEQKWKAGEITVEAMSNRLNEKADWTIDYKEYTEADIYYRKGTYDHWLDKAQLKAQNTINEQSTRYMIFLFNVLIDEYGYGKERLTRVQKYINDMLGDYRLSKNIVLTWRKILQDETGVVFEQPIDPLYQKEGSFMTGEQI